MITNRWPLLAICAATAIGLTTISVAAQTRATPGIGGGCPDGMKGGPIVGAQPIGGGGCEDSVYRSDEYSGTRGGSKKSTKPSSKPTVDEDKPTKKQRDRDR
jgi:hypothetical protein